MRAASEVALALRYDTVAYGWKLLGLIDPHDPSRYWWQNRTGERWAEALLVAALFVTMVGFARRRVGWLGLLLLALFLGPPLLTRATVSRLNFPSLRQLFLPLLLGAPLLLAALSHRRRWLWAGIGVWIVLLSVQSTRSFGVLAPGAGGLEPAVMRLSADVPPSFDIVGISDDTCGFAPSLVRDGPSVLAIPAGHGEADPVLKPIDDDTLMVESPAGFDILEKPQKLERESGINRGPAWLLLTPPALVAVGWQRIRGATVAISARDEKGITRLRYRFDRPLSEIVFLRYRGCAAPTRVRLESF